MAGATRDQAESQQGPVLLDSLVISQITNVWSHGKQSSEELWLPRSPVPVTNPAKYRNTGKGSGEMPRWEKSPLHKLRRRAQWCTPVILTLGRKTLPYLVTCFRGFSVSAVEMGIGSFLVLFSLTPEKSQVLSVLATQIVLFLTLRGIIHRQ